MCLIFWSPMESVLFVYRIILFCLGRGDAVCLTLGSLRLAVNNVDEWVDVSVATGNQNESDVCALFVTLTMIIRIILHLDVCIFTNIYASNHSFYNTSRPTSCFPNSRVCLYISNRSHTHTPFSVKCKLVWKSTLVTKFIRFDICRL